MKANVTDAVFSTAIFTLDTDYQIVSAMMTDANAGAGKEFKVKIRLIGTAAENYQLTVDEISATIAINKLVIDCAAVAWDYTIAFAHAPGRMHAVTLHNIPIGIKADYTGNTATDAGNYTAKAMLGFAAGYSSVNYQIINATVDDLYWAVNQATYGDKTANASVTYGNSCSISIDLVTDANVEIGTLTGDTAAFSALTVDTALKTLTLTVKNDIDLANTTKTLVIPVSSKNYAPYVIMVMINISDMDVQDIRAHRIKVEDTDNGTVTVSPTTAEKGRTVAIQVKSDEGHDLDELIVTAKNNREITVTKKDDGFIFKMPDSMVKVVATFKKIEAPPVFNCPFVDVRGSDWFYADVAFVYQQGMMNGISHNAFCPDITTSRGMIVAILYRLEGSPTVFGNHSFNDVKVSSYYKDAITWAASHGIVSGYNNDEFGTDDKITREQMASILYRYAAYKGYDVSCRADLSKFVDVGSISSYAADAASWANVHGLIQGVNNSLFNPAGNATRSQVAAILHRFCNEFVEENSV